MSANPEPDLFPDARIYRGQVYRPICTRPHLCRDGRQTLLAVWESHCVQCGAPFTLTTPLHAGKFQPNRRCQQHKRPGSTV
ncbi:hypothetical protein [Parafrankia sp. BMG5.11]|uniref:hypothetical protein n=1 Tax=Parafrankia sp. BMG5.11 TaxID=222540 RepID=UPI001404613D|nr:hypothetical protein [Parafrankia sp. BMG5.11]